MNFVPPAEVIGNLWARIPNYVKLTFIFTVALGFLVHMFVLTNFLTNTDSSRYFYEGVKDLGPSHGRWFHYFASYVLNPILPAPWLNGLWAFTFIGLSACIIAYCLQIRSALSCFILAGLMTASPVLAMNFFFTPFVPANFSALFLACLGVLIAHNYKYGGLGGAVLLACSLGVYQAYYAAAAGLCLMILILGALGSGASPRQIFFRGCRFLLFLVLGLLLYLLIVLLTTDGGRQLSDYLNTNRMFQFDIWRIIFSVINAYKVFFDYYWDNYYNWFPQAHSLLCLTLLALGGGFLAVLAVVNKTFREPRLLILIGLFLLVLPLAIGFAVVASNTFNSRYQISRVLYCLVLAPVFVLALLEACVRACRSAGLKRGARIILLAASCWTATGGLTLLIYHDALASNYLYTQTYIAYEQGYAWALEVMARVKKVEGYNSGRQVLFIDKEKRESKTAAKPQGKDMFRVANPPYPQKFNSYSHFFEIFMGLPNPSRHVRFRNHKQAREALGKLGLLDEVIAMPTYPEEGSIKVVGDKIVVNFSHGLTKE